MYLLLIGPDTNLHTIEKYVNKFSLRSEKTTIIDFSNLLTATSKYNNSSQIINIIDGNKLINKRVDKLGSELKLKLSKLLKHYCIMNLSSMAELNFSNLLWQDFILISCINNEIRNKKIRKVIVVGFPDNFINLIDNYKNKKPFYKVKTIVNRFKNSLTVNYLFYRNFISDLFFSFKKSSEIELNNKFTHLIYSDINKQWLNKENQIYNRYLGYNFNRNFHNAIFVVSAVRRNSLSLKNPLAAINDLKLIKDVKNKIILESFLSPFEVIKIYFDRKKKYLLKDTRFINELSKFIGSYYLNYHLKNFIFVEIAKQRILLRAFDKILKKLPSLRHGLIPIHELVEGRMVIQRLNVNKINTYGFQHGPIGQWSKWRFHNSVDAINMSAPEFSPNKIFVEGKTIKKSFVFYKKNKVKVIGAPRIENISNSKNKYSKNIIVFLDMHNWKNNLKMFQNAVNFSGYRIILRSHPSQINFLKKYLKTNNDFHQLTLDNNKDIYQSIKELNPIMCLIGDSGVILELALNKIPCVVIKNYGKPNNSPLEFNFKNINKINDYTDIKKFIELFKNSKVRDKYIRIQYFFAKQHIESVGKKAEKNLLNELS